MQIGAMNHPAEDVVKAIEWMAGLGLESMDLTLEPPAALPQQLDTQRVAAAIEKYNIHPVGHTAYYLPIASPYQSLRRAAVEEGRACIDAAAACGCQWINIHPDGVTPFHEREWMVERNLESLAELARHAQDAGIGLMVENMPGSFNNVQEMAELLDPMPELGILLDIGHCHLKQPPEQNPTVDIIERFGSRIRHVHLHDNRGGDDDLHLPLGSGTVPWKRAVRALQAVGYDQTITLEVFAEDKRLLTFSRDRLREWWDAKG